MQLNGREVNDDDNYRIAKHEEEIWKMSKIEEDVKDRRRCE